MKSWLERIFPLIEEDNEVEEKRYDELIQAITHEERRFNALKTLHQRLPVFVRRGGERIVYIARQDGTFEPRVVVVGQPIEGRVRVLSGLDSGQRVATGGVLLFDCSEELPF